METKMNAEIDESTNPHKYADALFDFCTTFEQEWMKGNIRVWSPPIGDAVAANLTQLLGDVQVVLDGVEERWEYTQTQPFHGPQNEDEWALDRFKCIVNDLLDRLRKTRWILDILLNNNEVPEQSFKKGYQTIILYSRQIDLFVEKAFPLLKKNKSYGDIDWQNEFKNL
jgi:hypothetical protein